MNVSQNKQIVTKCVKCVHYKCFRVIITIRFYDSRRHTCTGYFTSNNEPDGIENATHNTFAKLT
jgi:hypothetical protein